MIGIKRWIIVIVGSATMLSCGYLIGKSSVENVDSNTTIQVEKNIISPEMIALVNLDEGVNGDGEQRQYYAQSLMNIPETGYAVTSLEDARTGVAENRYAGYILVPADFSEKIQSINSTLQKANITYGICESLTAEEKKKVNDTIREFVQNMDNSASYLYLNSVMNEFHDAQRSASAILSNDQKDFDAISNIQPENLLAKIMFPTLENNPVLPETTSMENYIQKNDSCIQAVEEHYSTGIEAGKEELNQLLASGEDLSKEWSATQEKLNSVDVLHNEGETGPVYEEELNTLKENLSAYNEKLLKVQKNVETNLETAERQLEDSIKNYNEQQLEDGKKIAAENIYQALIKASTATSITYDSDVQELQITIGGQIIGIPALQGDDGIVIAPEDLKDAETYLNQMQDTSVLDQLVGEQVDKDSYIAAIQNEYLDSAIPKYSVENPSIQDILKNVSEQMKKDLKLRLPDGNEDGNAFVDAEAVTAYVNDKIIGKVESRANTVTTSLSSQYDSQKESLTKYQDRLGTYDPLQYVDQEGIKAQYTAMRENNSELQESISKDTAEKTEYISGLTQTTQKNMDTLRQSVTDAEEEAKLTLETGLKDAKNTKASTSEVNQQLLYSFMTKLPNTKVGDLENTTAYQFMVNPLLVTQDSVEKATVQENDAVVNTENKKNQTEKDYGIILLVLIGICVLSIGGAVMYRNKRRQKDSSPFDE